MVSCAGYGRRTSKPWPLVMDTYSMHARRRPTAVVTGKPIERGRSRGRREATRPLRDIVWTRPWANLG